MHLIPATLISGGAIIIGALVKSVWDMYKPEKGELTNHKSTLSSDTSSGKMAKPEESLLQSTIYVLQGFWEWGISNRLTRAVFLLIIVSIIASCSAHAVYEGFPGLHSVIFNETPKEDDSNTSEEIQEDEASPGNVDMQPPLSNEESEPEPEFEPELEPEPEPFLLDSERYYKLTEAEENKLFFLDGSNKITNWTDSYAIANQLYPFVEELLAPQTENIFDNEAPETVKNEIADASELEKEMTNSNQLDNIIEVRTEAWENYPKRGIANLLANNMQRYAQEYTAVGGAYEAIKYYHAQSIFWTWESLAFNYVTPYMLKDSLNYISMRYHDIADEAANGSEEQIRASALSEAFKILENMDFTPSDEKQMDDSLVIEPASLEEDANLASLE